jgi:hypothetical protein
MVQYLTLKMVTGEISHWEMKFVYQNESEFGYQVTEITQTGMMRPQNRKGYKIVLFEQP